MPRRRRASALAAGMLALLAACGTPAPSASPGPATPTIDEAEIGLALCEAVDQVELAIGDRRSGAASGAWLALETALSSGDRAAIDAASGAVLGHLANAARAASRGGAHPVSSEAGRAWQTLASALGDAVQLMRDGALDGDREAMDRGRQQLEATLGASYGPAAGALATLAAAGYELPCA